MAAPSRPHAFYRELAVWWPLISPVDEYADEAAFAARLLASASGQVHEVLELGSGGGHNARHLTQHFALTLVDLSPDMLAVSRALNPEAVHQEGDMRTVRLGRTFDAVFVHDAVDYMTSEADLRRAIETAFVHCRPGGVAVFMPDDLADTFEPDTEHGGVDGDDGRGARYLEWTWDPDPTDTWAATEYVFVLRDPAGAVTTVHETHRIGLFTREVWQRLLSDTGFDVRVVSEELGEQEQHARDPREIFVARRQG